MESKIIGNGSFGYIFSPCLDFNDDIDINKKRYITKLLYNKDAEDELKNIKLLNDIDISCNYHLGQCYKTTLIYDIHKNIIADYNLSLFKKLNMYDLTPIIMKNGGYNLNYYAKQFKIYSIDNIDIIYLFLKEYYKLLEGIKLFNEKNIILRDIKPANILYDIYNNKLVFIDFGLTDTKSNIIKLSTESNNELSIYYSSFPFESNYYNLDKYKTIKKKTKIDIEIFCANLELVLIKKIYIQVKINVKLLDLFKDLTNYYYNLKNNDDKNENIKNMLIKFKYSLLNLKNTTYDKFLTTSLNTLDSYSYGLTLIFILNHIEHIISNNLFIVLMDLAIKLSFIDLNDRLSIDEALVKFKSIINEYIDNTY